MNSDFSVGDKVIVNEVTYGDPVVYTIKLVQRRPDSAGGTLYLMDDPNGNRISRLGNQIMKVE
jgi:hypothetical protein